MAMITRAQFDTLLGDQQTSFETFLDTDAGAKLKARLLSMALLNTVAKKFTDTLDKMLADAVIDQLCVDRFIAA